MKKICFIVPTLKKGGMERVITELSNYLVNDYAITIICAVNGEVKYELDERVVVVGNKCFKKLDFLSFLYSNIRKEKPNVVIGFSEFLNPYTILCSILNNVPVYVSDRSNPIKKHSLRDRIFRKLTYPLAKGIIAQTEFAKSVLSRNKYNNNIFVLNNPLIKLKNEVRMPEKKGIIMIGRLAASKNQHDLIEIFSKTSDKEWLLYIVGDGNQKENLISFVSELNISERVIFTGEVNDTEEYMSRCSIFAFTSLSEGFPNALSEAIAFPLSTIAYNCHAGVADLIEDNVNGYLIDVGDKMTFINKLNHLMGSVELRDYMMNNGLKNRDKFHISEIAKKLVKKIEI